MADKYAVNYNDEKLVNIQQEQAQKESELTQTFDNMINNSDQFYNAQIEASKDWANKQTEIQQANTNFTIEKIEQQKEQANKDYTKEQKGAYADYQKQTNDYSVNAEQMASAGLNNTGYSETSKVAMYNTYQNRVATARESLNQAMLNYDNGIKEALLNNSSKLAEIAFNALQNQLQLSLEGFQYKNTLIQTKQDQLAANGDRYNQRYQQMLSQLNEELNRNMQYDTWKTEFDTKNKQWEREFSEQQKQWQKEYEAQQRQWQQEYALKQKQYQQQAAKNASYAVTGSSNKKTSLSATAKDIQNAYGRSLNDARNGKHSTGYTEKIEQIARDGLAKIYQAGKLTKTEFATIANNLGLD